MSDLDKMVVAVVRESLADGIAYHVQAYNSPLREIVGDALERKSGMISALILEAVDELATDGEFRDAIKGQLKHQLARVIVSKGGGEYEKRLAELRANPETRARITLAITTALDQLEA